MVKFTVCLAHFTASHHYDRRSPRIREVSGSESSQTSVLAMFQHHKLSYSDNNNNYVHFTCTLFYLLWSNNFLNEILAESAVQSRKKSIVVFTVWLHVTFFTKKNQFGPKKTPTILARKLFWCRLIIEYYSIVWTSSSSALYTISYHNILVVAI